ncbi:MAG TPA: putative molybdenum carrier protein [Chthoniobacterales bacterium]|nr:putative molybdenum carrier protein [Chthoniobacterales bacterium]
MKRVISGGQTGVDQAALCAARDCGLEIGGWCPPGRVSEDGVISAEFPLEETERERSPDAPDVPRSQRTEWNVRDADGTLIVRRNDCSPSADVDWTIECARRFQRPLLVCDVGDPEAKQKIDRWLAVNKITTLNVAGPSEATAPGIGEKAYALLKQVLTGL